MFDLASLVKYVLEGLAVIVAAFVIPQKNLNFQEILLLGLAAAATFALLDMYAPTVANGARFGSGFGVGMAQVGGSPSAQGGNSSAGAQVSVAQCGAGTKCGVERR